MNTRHDTADDIIDLTDIVEEGTPADSNLDFAMDEAVDASSLDKELDDLLQGGVSATTASAGDEPGMDLGGLFDEDLDSQPTPAPETPKSIAAPVGDLSDLDDLFDSLHAGPEDEGPSSLDLLLNETSHGKKDSPSPAPQLDDTIDLDLDVPELGAEGATGLLELTDELLADIPETVLVPPAGSHGKPFDEISTFPSPEAPDLEIDSQRAEDEHSPATTTVDEPESAAQAQDVFEEESLSQAAFEILSARIDALEAKPEAVAEIRPEQVLAALPQSPDGLPLAQGLRADILQAVEAKIAGLPTLSDIKALQQNAAENLWRIEALEARPAPVPEIRPEQVLAAMPLSPEDLPLAGALRTEILEMVETKVADLATAESVSELQQTLDGLQGQLDSLSETLAAAEASPAPDVREVESAVASLNGGIRDLKQHIDGMQAAMAERDAIISELREALERLQEELEALSARLDARPDAAAIKAELEEYVGQQVPTAVARIIREEIQALLKEMGG
jgi:uncharacterized coiled-coil protein SlyX